jgi:hypothetical protein
MAYGELITVGLISLGLTALGVGGAGIAKQGDVKDAEKKQKAAESEQRKQEKAQKIAESKQRQASGKAQALDTEIDLRERLHQQTVGQSDQTTAYVDEYRAKLGLTGEGYDQVLSSLYAEERSLALETQKNAIIREEKEIEDSQETNYGQIALYSFLGLAAIGSVVYLKQRQQ